MWRHLVGIIVGVAIAAPAANAQATTLSGSIDGVSPEGTLSAQGFHQTITFEVMFTCTAGDVAAVEGFLFQAVGARRFGAVAFFSPEQILCTGERQTVTLTAPTTSDPPFLFVPGTAVGQVSLTVCDPTLSACDLADRMIIEIRLVHG